MTAEEDLLLATKRFRVVKVRQPLPGGAVREREVVRHPGAVTVLPMVDDGHVCLIRNYRPAIGETLIELPAGTLEQGEAPEATAARELLEETGYAAGKLTLLQSFYLSPGILDERMRLYLATDLVEKEPQREPGEQIENLILAWEDAVALVFDQQIHDAKTITGLLYYDHLRGR
jgi:ADP-ribose pyrophosphatase